MVGARIVRLLFPLFCVGKATFAYSYTADAQDKCVSDGGYLAKILNADEEMMMEELVGQFGWNRYGQTSNSFDKQFYIGLQRAGLYNGTNTYYWRDNWQQPLTNDAILSNVADGYSSSLFSVATNPTFPFGTWMEPNTTQIFWYTNIAELGPWQDDPITNSWIGQYAGAYCRRDLNPCGSNPCPTGQTCFANGSCYYCLQTTSTSTSTTTPTTISASSSNKTTTTYAATSTKTAAHSTISSTEAKSSIWWPVILLISLMSAILVVACAFCLTAVSHNCGKRWGIATTEF